MAKKKTTMPQSMAGLTRFNDSDSSIIKIKPAHVIVLLVIVVLIVVFLHLQGDMIFNVPQLFLSH